MSRKVPAVVTVVVDRGGHRQLQIHHARGRNLPPTPFDQFAEALLRVGEGAYLHGESVLALFDLAVVNPRRVKVAVPRRTRSKLSAFIELTRARGKARTTLYEGLAAQPVADAILECRSRIETERLLNAAEQARGEGLLTTTEWQRVQKGLQT